MTLPAGLARAYRLTCYRCGPATLRIGRRCPALDRVVGRQTLVLLTAWNPLSRLMPAGWNRRVQRRLRAQLRHRRVIDGSGALGRWHEDLLGVIGDRRPAVRLARRFRQRAVVVLRRRQAVRVVVLG
jgi:hypothetical protein